MLSEDLLSERLGRAGVITLNRPKALNALTLGMVHGIVEALRASAPIRRWRMSSSGRRASGPSAPAATSARTMSAASAGRLDEMLGFYRDEYRTQPA